MRILKFGGTSIQNADRIKNVGNILQDYSERNIPFTAVFSAMSGVTDLLISMATKASKGDQSYREDFEVFKNKHNETIDSLLSEEYKKIVSPTFEQQYKTLEDLLYGIYLVLEASPRTMDYVLSFGERSSAFLIAHYMQQRGVPSEFLDSRDIIITNEQFGNAQVHLKLTYQKIADYFKDKTKAQIVTGFIGSTKGGLSTTLGRGGSDYTAALLGAGLGAELIEIWTDVNGVLTSDPRRVKQAFTIPKMSYLEAVEMSHFGAKVIYAPTMQPAMDKNIPLVIKNSLSPENNGTFISAVGNSTDHPVKGISAISDVALLTLQGNGMVGVPGTAARLFKCLADAGINIMLITQGSSEYSISFAILPDEVRKASLQIQNEFKSEFERNDLDHLHIENELSILAIIGDNMRFVPGVAAKMMRSLGNNGINIIAIAQGSSERNISVVINKEDENKALNALHEGFFLSDTKVINLFVVGTGLIGSTLLKQIREQKESLLTERGVEIRLIGLANSKKMKFNIRGIDLDHWKTSLDSSSERMNMQNFIKKMDDINLINSVFVDNTATYKISQHYRSILEQSIHIVTPNKIATSSSYEEYANLKKIAHQNNVTFGYETNVGAGLPVISTLQNLINSGDKIIKIEGVLSGSLSYIFNVFDGSVPFSKVVQKAKELGFTEPDPRIDLSGVDVKRKIVILSREAGMKIEPNEVIIDSFLPQECMEADGTEEFFSCLEKNDNYFEKLLQNAQEKNERLRIIASMENKKVNISLQSVDSSSPFFNLEGSDNMIVFTTQRYHKRSLVVQGPGAGAEVTAAGVFAEIINIESKISPI